MPTLCDQLVELNRIPYKEKNYFESLRPLLNQCDFNWDKTDVNPYEMAWAARSENGNYIAFFPFKRHLHYGINGKRSWVSWVNDLYELEHYRSEAEALRALLIFVPLMLALRAWSQA